MLGSRELKASSRQLTRSALRLVMSVPPGERPTIGKPFEAVRPKAGGLSFCGTARIPTFGVRWVGQDSNAAPRRAVALNLCIELDNI